MNIRENILRILAFTPLQTFLHPLSFSGELSLPIVPFLQFLKTPTSVLYACHLRVRALLPRGRCALSASPVPWVPACDAPDLFLFVAFVACGWVVSFSPGPRPLLPITFIPRRPLFQSCPSSRPAHCRTPALAARAPRAPLPAGRPLPGKPPLLPPAPSPARLAAAGANPRAAPCYSGYCV